MNDLVVPHPGRAWQSFTHTDPSPPTQATLTSYTWDIPLRTCFRGAQPACLCGRESEFGAFLNPKAWVSCSACPLLQEAFLSCSSTRPQTSHI